MYSKKRCESHGEGRKWEGRAEKGEEGVYARAEWWWLALASWGMVHAKSEPKDMKEQ